ncbi:MAG: formylglycine-generating enzyme family protein [Pseudomonadota bacterium]
MSDQTQTLRYAAFAVAMGLTGCNAPQPSATEPSASCGLGSDQLGLFVDVPAGSFVKGDAPVYPEETPTLRLQVEGFQIQTHEVTNAQFSAFVEATGYVTDSEQGLMDGREGAGSAVFLHPDERTEPNTTWILMSDATWKTPEGDGSSIQGRENQPVVHVSKRDAEAYASWAGGRLPSEIEWEYAATLGLPDADNPTSGAYDENGPRANTWQGVFPVVDLGSDGHSGAAPIGCFEPDRLGLYDMIGNVWEWTDTPFGEGTHTMKGGSYLCADNFCRRYRPAARHPQGTDFSSNHTGFRIVKDLSPGAAG